MIIDKILKERSLKDILEEMDKKSLEESNSAPRAITEEYAKEELKNAFARISTINEKKIKYIAKEDLLKEKRKNGALKFKRHLLGYFGSNKILTVDELVNKSIELKIFDSEEIARGILPLINNFAIHYTNSRYLKISRFENFDGKIAYRILSGSNWGD